MTANVDQLVQVQTVNLHVSARPTPARRPKFSKLRPRIRPGETRVRSLRQTQRRALGVQSNGTLEWLRGPRERNVAQGPGAGEICSHVVFYLGQRSCAVGSGGNAVFGADWYQ